MSPEKYAEHLAWKNSRIQDKALETEGWIGNLDPPVNEATIERLKWLRTSLEAAIARCSVEESEH